MTTESGETLSKVEKCSEEIGVGSSLESFAEADEVAGLIEKIKTEYTQAVCLEICLEQLSVIFDRYQEQPHLLDPHLDDLLNQLLTVAINPSTENVLKHQCFKVLYIITKVRGYKVVLRHLPHEVSDLEPVLNLLDAQNPSDTLTWETRYMLLLWLSIIVMIPFQLTRLDANVVTELGVKKSVTNRILEIGKKYLMVNDKPQDAAAYLISRFVTRPDIKEIHLEPFIEWTLNGTSIGPLSSLALLFKHGKREDLLPHVSRVLNALMKKDFKTMNNTILRKLAMKLTQRLGMTSLKARVASWRYQRGSRSLEINLTCPLQRATKSPEIDEKDEDFDIPEDVELILQILLNGLNDKDTIIRWSAAKGIGRVCSRLPKELADEVVGSVLELFSNRDRDAVWHGGCLALAELGRRGLLLPERLSAVVPIVLKALVYDEQKGSYSVGDHIRDAACYVCWAFARAYDAQEMKPFVSSIANALLIVTVFDREIHCRRAASAAFQENVGRQGTFPHGIDIVTTADYFAVGQRANAFLNISVFIAKFPEYTKSLIDHLVEIKMNHWDVAIRELTALALHNMTPVALDYMSTVVLPKLLPLATGSDMNTRHGAILAISEIIHSLFLHRTSGSKFLDEGVVKGVRDVIPILQEKKMFRGFGSELMRTASCKLIQKSSLSKLPFHGDTVIDIWQNVIDDSLRTVDYPILKAASQTITSFCNEYYQDSDGKPHIQKQEWLINNYLHELQSSVETTRMGFCMALGSLPPFMTIGKLASIIPAVVECTTVTEKTAGWVKARKEALIALGAICQTVNSFPDGDVELKAEYLESILECHLNGLNDYTIDSCGDVGSHVRAASLVGFKILVKIMAGTDRNLITPELSHKMMSGIIQQCVEKITNMRLTAGNTLCQLLYGEPSLPHVPHREQLLQFLPKEECENMLWSEPAETFPKFASLLSLSSYLYPLLLGFCATIGSLSEHLVRACIPAMGNYLKSADEENIQLICDTLLQIFNDHLGVTRVTQPLMKSVDQLLSTGYFDVILLKSNALFGLKMLNLVKKEIGKCKDPAKIMSGVSVLCDLLSCESSCRNKVLFQLCLLLNHPWPLIRKDTATKMFTAFATYDGIVECEETLTEIMNLLSETNWVEGREGVRHARNTLCDLLQIQRPVLIGKK